MFFAKIEKQKSEETMKKVLMMMVLLCPISSCFSASDEIRFNQLGYYPKSVKRCVVVNSDEVSFEIRDTKGQTVYTGHLVDRGLWDKSKEKVKVGDFTEFERTGAYTIYVKDKGESFEFEIAKDIYHDVLRAAAKAYYYQRASMELEEKYAGKWSRPAGHPDDSVTFHPLLKMADSTLNSSGGW